MVITGRVPSVRRNLRMENVWLGFDVDTFSTVTVGCLQWSVMEHLDRATMIQTAPIVEDKELSLPCGTT